MKTITKNPTVKPKIIYDEIDHSTAEQQERFWLGLYGLFLGLGWTPRTMRRRARLFSSTSKEGCADNEVAEYVKCRICNKYQSMMIIMLVKLGYVPDDDKLQEWASKIERLPLSDAQLRRQVKKVRRRNVVKSCAKD